MDNLENISDNLDNANYDDLLTYATKLMLKTNTKLTMDDMANKESLAMWISENEPDYNPEDKDN